LSSIIPDLERRAKLRSSIRALNANIEEIVEANGRAGFFGYVRSLVEAIQRSLLLLLIKSDLSSYDRVVIAHPFGVSVSSPFAHI